jgi:hypothetical protein
MYLKLLFIVVMILFISLQPITAENGFTLNNNDNSSSCNCDCDNQLTNNLPEGFSLSNPVFVIFLVLGTLILWKIARLSF